MNSIVLVGRDRPGEQRPVKGCMPGNNRDVTAEIARKTIEGGGRNASPSPNPRRTLQQRLSHSHLAHRLRATSPSNLLYERHRVVMAQRLSDARMSARATRALRNHTRRRDLQPL